MCFSSSWRRSHSACARARSRTARRHRRRGRSACPSRSARPSRDPPSAARPRGRRRRTGASAQRVLESGREQLLDLELGDELVEAYAVALQMAAAAMRVADAGGGMGRIARPVTGRARPCGARGPASGPVLAGLLGGRRGLLPRRPPARSPVVSVVAAPCSRRRLLGAFGRRRLRPGRLGLRAAGLRGQSLAADETLSCRT